MASSSSSRPALQPGHFSEHANDRFGTDLEVDGRRRHIVPHDAMSGREGSCSAPGGHGSRRAMEARQGPRPDRGPTWPGARAPRGRRPGRGLRRGGGGGFPIPRSRAGGISRRRRGAAADRARRHVVHGRVRRGWFKSAVPSGGAIAPGRPTRRPASWTSSGSSWTTSRTSGARTPERRPELRDDQDRAVPAIHESGCGIARRGDRPVLLPGRPQGVYRPRLLR